MSQKCGLSALGKHPVVAGGYCYCGLVVCGSVVWKQHATHGLPLDITIPLLWDTRKVIPTWPEILLGAQKDGANVTTLINKLIIIIKDTYPPEISGEIVDRLESYRRNLCQNSKKI